MSVCTGGLPPAWWALAMLKGHYVTRSADATVGGCAAQSRH